MVIFFNFFRRLAQRTLRSDATVVLLWLLVVLVIGTVAYALIEGWSWLDSLYATIITITTVGYGDLSPQTESGRIFAIFFTLFAIGIGGYTISTVAANVIENRSEKKAKKLRKRRMRRLESLENHYIICGADKVGVRIAEELYLVNAPFVIIDPDEESLKNALLFTHPEYFRQKIRNFKNFDDTDLSEFEDRTLAELAEMLDTSYILDTPVNDQALVNAGISRAKGLIAAMPDDRDNLAIIVGARALSKRYDNEQIRIMARVEDGSFARKMFLAGADNVRITAITSGQEMAMHMLHPEIGNWWYTIMGVHMPNAPRIEQQEVSARPEWIGKTVGDLHQTLGVVTMAVKRNDLFESPPPAGLTIQPDDILITLTQYP